jgi:D-serine deaminase-like pyridoxal phosphate-dependent protein
MQRSTTVDVMTELETPVLVLDESRMEANIARMRSHLNRHGVQFRPHAKTSKSVDVVQRILGAPTGPITVSTLKEADYFASHGFTDILYAVGLAPNKFTRVFDLCARGVAVTVILDNLEVAKQLVEAAHGNTARPSAMLEIDSDGHRSGVQPGSHQLIQIADCLREGGLTLKGVLTHAGSSYDCRSREDIVRVAQQERDAAVTSAQRLRAQGHDCLEVSIGSTPTAQFAEDLTGVTEVRAGVFVFGDLVMSGIGVTRPNDIAISVLATVVGHQHDKGWTIVDAGWMALSRDRGTSRQALDQGYGVVCNAAGEPLDDVIVIDANQEHGVIARRSGSSERMPHLPVGTLVRILPNHACATAAQHDRYFVTGGADTRVRAVWPRLQGW